MAKIENFVLYPGFYVLFALVVFAVQVDKQRKTPMHYSEGFFGVLYEPDVEANLAAHATARRGYDECMLGKGTLIDIKYRDTFPELYYEALGAGLECRSKNRVWSQYYRFSSTKALGNLLVFGLIPALAIWLAIYNYRRREDAPA